MGEHQRQPRPLAPRPLTEPHPSRLPPGTLRRTEILALHSAAMAAGEDGYLDPDTGRYVFTAASLADREACCGQGCRHCPYVGG